MLSERSSREQTHIIGISGKIFNGRVIFNMPILLSLRKKAQFLSTMFIPPKYCTTNKLK